MKIDWDINIISLIGLALTIYFLTRKSKVVMIKEAGKVVQPNEAKKSESSDWAVLPGDGNTSKIISGETTTGDIFRYDEINPDTGDNTPTKPPVIVETKPFVPVSNFHNLKQLWK